MAVTKLTCPECGKVLRPARPVAEGKKVKCPSCETVFVAGDDEEDVRPRKSAGKPAKGGAKPAAKKGGSGGKEKEAPKKKSEDDDVETYGYVKDPDEERDEEDKPRVKWSPDESVKDPRGPAIIMMRGAANALQMVGMMGTLGWLGIFVLLLIPTVFPITDDSKDKDKDSKGAVINPQDKEKDKGKKGPTGPKFFEFFGTDLSEYFLLLMVPMLGMGVYSSMIVGGGIKMQNLESRTWGIVGSVMALLPLNVLGIQIASYLILQWLIMLILEDQEFVYMVAGGLMVIEWLASLAVGGWALSILLKEEVKEGFEYKAE